MTNYKVRNLYSIERSDSSMESYRVKKDKIYLEKEEFRNEC